MLQQKALAQYCENNILEIPNSLFSMRDVKPMLYSDESSIFYKDLERDLIDIEFYTMAPCIVYIKAGREVITTCNNASFVISSGEAILLPMGLNLYSDYVHKGNGLHAYLLFFGPEVLSRFLSTNSISSAQISNEEAILKLKIDHVIREYFTSLHSVYKSLNNSTHLLQLKLLELLHLLDINDNGKLRSSLLSSQKCSTKRNIQRLMKQCAISDLNAKDLAALSGRSISTFNKEFKAFYNTTPKQWLIEQRLMHAYRLLTEQQWSVTAAALEVGYSNVSHFIAAFKKKYGKTPHQVKFDE